jgi:aminopeptidase N
MNNLMGQPLGRYSGSVVGRSDTIFWDSFSDRVYNKGAIILHMLRGLVGDSTFFSIMRDYINNPEFRYANARTEDFIKVCEKHFGKRLDWYFNEWLYSRADASDRPVYSFSWTSIPEKGSHTVRLLLQQTETPLDIYTMPLTVAIHTSAGRAAFSVVDSLREQTFKFVVKDPPLRLDLDPENWVFKSVKEVRGSR